MEYTQWGVDEKGITEKLHVLILVVMEYTQWVINILKEIKMENKS